MIKIGPFKTSFPPIKLWKGGRQKVGLVVDFLDYKVLLEPNVLKWKWR